MFDLYTERALRKRFGSGKGRLKIYSTLAVGFFILLLAGILGVGLLFAWYAKDLPRPDKIKRIEGLTTVILDRNGEKIYDIFLNVDRIPVKWEDVPAYLKDGTVAVEDKDFYRHQGLSTVGIARALVNIFIFRNFQGGSTLTQQLVKNALLNQERTLPRKIKEAILSIQIERKYTKDEILNMYLNEAPYGGTAVGAEAASQQYFGKRLKELGLVECVIIAGLPQAPSTYSPFGKDPKAYIWRSEQVLRRMREDGYISKDQESEAKKLLLTVQFRQGESIFRAQHFVEYIKQQLIEKFGSKVVDAGGMKVTTTLDVKLQDKAEKIVSEEIDKIKKLKATNGAVVVIDPRNGQILAMVGSKNYDATESGGFKYNVVTQGLRQPGSAIKPFTYAAAFKKGYTPSTLLLDVDTKYPSGDPKKPEYNPKNYDGKYRGPIQLRYALGNSINTIAVKVSALVGIKDVLRLANDMGLTTLEPTDANVSRFGLSLTLGGGEVRLLDLTHGFGVFATAGMRSDPVSILKVEDASGKTFFENRSPAPRRVLEESIAYLISHILSDNSARKDVFGEKSYLVIPGKTVAVKTGTTDDKRDNWTVGYTPSVVTGVWVGNNDNTPMNPALASGITGAAPIWNRIMQEAMKGKSDEPFVRPNSIVEMDIESFGGGLPIEGQPTRKELFISGTEPNSIASIYQMLKISRHDGNKLAGSVEIARNEYDSKQYVLFTEKDPVSTDGKNRWQEGIDAWLATQPDSRYHPPTEVYQGSDTIGVSITQPGDKSQINDNNVKIVAQAGSNTSITKMELFIDGQSVKTTGDKQFNETIYISNGSHSIRMKATDSQGNSAESEIHVGINQPFATPTPSPSPTPTPS